MEYLDVYDENKNYLGKYSREYVHQNALWHNTVHCWIYDKDGNVYFQIRKEEEKLYTTASGHVLSGETIKEAFGREVKEEIGIEIPYEDAILIDTHEYKADKIKKEGTVFKDRAFVNVYGYLYSDDKKFKFDLSEVNGLVKINAKETLKLFNNENEDVSAEIINQDNKYNKNIRYEDFLTVGKETPMEKYGYILKRIVELTDKK